MKKNILWFLFILLFLQLKVLSQTDPILFRQISPKGGFTYGAIRTITQDSLGYIWFGTEHGLYSYNTKACTKFNLPDECSGSFPDDNIRKILTTEAGKLWVLTTNGICYFNYQTYQFIPVKYSINSSTFNLPAIQDIAENKSGQLFAVFINRIGLFDTKSIGNIDFLPLTLSQNENLTAVVFDKRDQLWIGTSNGNIYRSAPPYRNMKLFCKQRSEAVLALCSDNNTLWIGYDWGGADHVNDNGTIIEHYAQNMTGKNYIPHNRVRQIMKDSQNQIWIATYSGILLVSDKRNQVIKSDRLNNLPANSIYSLYTDVQKGIWIGTWSGGLAYLNPKENRFLHIQEISNKNMAESSVISSFAQDHSGLVWVGNENGGLSSIDLKTMTFQYFQIPENITETANIKSLAVDHENRLWLGTFSSGLWLFDKNKKTFESLKLLNDSRVYIYGICPVKEGLWLASYSHGLIYYDFKTHNIRHFYHKPSDSFSISSNTARCLIVDNYGGIWVGTQLGLNYLAKGTNKFVHYDAHHGKNSISNNEIFSLFEDHSGKIWIGTGGNGVDCFDPNTTKFSNLSLNEGLAGDIVYGILEDEQHQMWFSTDNGISCYNAETKAFRNFHEEDGLQGNQFNPDAAFKTSNGLFLFGGPNGFNLIDPSKIELNQFEPVVRITKMFVNNEPLEKIAHSKFNHISTLSEIKLPYHDNSLSFEFMANNYILPQRNHFKYRLTNYSEKWIDAGVEGKATFTKIPPGKYELNIMASNNDGIWSSHQTRFAITILPPIWLSWYAYLLYLLLFVLTFLFVRREMRSRQKLKDELLIQRFRNEKDEELHQSRLQLFTNISHEFKTPLALILSPLEYITSQNTFDPEINDHLQIIKRNAERLKRLIGEIIDFRKLELGKSVFNPRKTDLVKLCAEISDYYNIYARDNHIDFSFHSYVHELFCEVDDEKLDKIIFNFLSNSFKYTTEGGKIKLCLRRYQYASEIINKGYSTNSLPDEPGIVIQVDDSAQGIEHEELPLIFDRFYQGSSFQHDGTGIGLHLCREYAKMHNGTIYVESTPGYGSTFSLLIPTKIIGSSTSSVEEKIVAIQPSESIMYDAPGKTGQTILIVEDNLEMQKHLKTIFQNEYSILKAVNGNQGFEIASEFSPDLIISDVMMPGKDGFELCSQLKGDIQTSHIPVILLTALSDIDKHINGLQTGADAYITKPFEVKLLIAQVKNLLITRKNLQNSFTQSQQEWEENSSLMPADKLLVNKAIRITEKHLLDENFSVENLSMELNISRSSLHRKIRALTNQSSSEFIRYVRLQKALELMKDGSYNLDEIGYAVGFSSHSYFTQSFKRQFGKTPSAYLSDLKNKE